MKAQFIKSVGRELDFPKPELPEIAFLGRSNVGKSSLLASLISNKKLVKISKNPGCTTLINYFSINDKLYFVDFPGYGYAKLSKKSLQDFKPLVEGFFETSKNIKLAIVIFDIRRNLDRLDIELIRYLENFEIDYKIVFTKIDKVSNNIRYKQLKEFKRILAIDEKDIFLFSAKNNFGRDRILGYIIN